MIQHLHPKSAAEIFANAAAIRKRLFSPQIASTGADQPNELRRVVRFASTLPLWQSEDTHFNAHEEFLAEWRINRPRAYVMAQAKAVGLSLADLTSTIRPRPLVAIRQRLMSEVWQLFGLSLAQIGILFGGRDHSTVLNALRKNGVQSTQIPPLTEKADEIYRLWRSGMTQQGIADRVGYTQSSVCRYMRRQPWWPKPERKRYIRDVGDRVAEMLAQGASLRAISDEVGFKADTVATYARSVGLMPPSDVRYIDDSAEEIKRMLGQGATYDQIAAATRFHARSIGKFVRRKGWTR